MPDALQPRIVVGIGPGHSDAALRAAAAQARARRTGVHLVHVVPDVDEPGGATGLARVVTAAERAGLIVAQAAARLKQLVDDGVPVTTGICHGEIVSTLAAATQDAALIVLEHRRTGRRSRGPLRSVTLGVLAQAHAPVLVVPEDWRPHSAADPSMVTVGLPASTAAHGILRAALDEADRLGARLLVVHAVDPTHEAATHDAAGADHLRQGRLQQAVIEVATERPDVPVEVVVVAGSPAGVLADAATRSALVVVGRRHSPTQSASPVGHVVSGGHVVHELLARCSCPLLVVDPLERSDRRSSLAGRRVDPAIVRHTSVPPL